VNLNPHTPGDGVPVELLDAYSRANGIDLHIGRKTPRLLRAAGLVDVQVNPIVHVYPPGYQPPFDSLADFVEPA